MFAKHTAALRSSVATPAGLLHTAEKPPGLVVQSRLFVELRQGLIPLHNIEAHAELELAQAHRTKVQRASVTFLQVIRPIHQTTEIDTEGTLSGTSADQIGPVSLRLCAFGRDCHGNGGIPSWRDVRTDSLCAHAAIAPGSTRYRSDLESLGVELEAQQAADEAALQHFIRHGKLDEAALAARTALARTVEYRHGAASRPARIQRRHGHERFPVPTSANVARLRSHCGSHSGKVG